jgi:hypothetical protein
MMEVLRPTRTLNSGAFDYPQTAIATDPLNASISGFRASGSIGKTLTTETTLRS